MRLQNYGLVPSVAKAAASALQADDAPTSIPELRPMLRLLARERAELERERERASLVWTGATEATGSEVRDTMVVMAEMVSKAEHSVLLSSYSWNLNAPMFEALVDRIVERPNLAVTLVLEPGDKRRKADDADAIQLKMRQDVLLAWPAAPHVPRLLVPKSSLSKYEPGGSGIHHAKFIVVDGRRILVTSANLTHAGLLANIELGVLLDCPRSATAVLREVERGVSAGTLVRII